MEYPNISNKYENEALFSPSDFMEYLRSIGKYPEIEVPSGAILCFQRKLLKHIANHENTTKVKLFYGENHLIRYNEKDILIVGNFGIGAPVACTLLEELIAFGIKRFIVVGLAGTLQKFIQIGDLIVCNRAIRDEGTSHHYLPGEKYAHASGLLTEKIVSICKDSNHKFHLGTSWTIDSVYRETVEEVKHYQKENVLSVEMETAALFAVAQHRNVETGAIFSVSDSLADLKWQPGFYSEKTEIGLINAYHNALKSLVI
jgi:uridine phosphorylase